MIKATLEHGPLTLQKVKVNTLCRMHGPDHPSSQSEHPLRTGGNVNSGFGNLTDVHLLVAQATSSKWSFADAAQNLFTHRMSGTPFQND